MDEFTDILGELLSALLGKRVSCISSEFFFVKGTLWHRLQTGVLEDLKGR